MNSKIKILLMIIVSFSLIWYLTNKIGINNLYSNIINANLWMLLLACAFIPVTIIIRTLRWFYIVCSVEPQSTLSDAFKSYLGGSFMAIFTPGKVGDLGRGFYYNKKRELTFLVIYEKLTDLFAYSVLSLAMVLKIGKYYGIILLFIVIIVSYALLRPGNFYNNIIRLLPNILSQHLKIYDNIIFTYKFKEISLKIVLMSIGITTVTILHFFIIINSFGYSSLLITFMVFPLSILLASIPISIGGVGVRESAIILLFSMYHIPKEAAMNASLFFYITNVIPYIFGIIYMPTFSSNFKTWIKKKINFNSLLI